MPKYFKLLDKTIQPGKDGRMQVSWSSLIFILMSCLWLEEHEYRQIIKI